jgi:uncharacterized protein
MRKVIITGGSGFLGQVLRNHFIKQKDQVLTIGRSNTNDLQWNGYSIGDWVNHLEGADILINLTGKSVNCRYTNKNMQEILDSRINSTRILNQVCSQLKSPPKCWMNSSSATIYAHSLNEPNTESKNRMENDFSVQVCKLWEKEFFETEIPNCNKVALRTAIVLGNKGGVYPELAHLVKFGLGGNQGDGKQMTSWIHESDFIRAVEYISSKKITGAINLCSPNPVPNQEFMASIRASMEVNYNFPIPMWAIKLGAFLKGTEAELVLKSRYVLPERLEQAGFKFSFPTINIAFRELNMTSSFSSKVSVLF